MKVIIVILDMRFKNRTSIEETAFDERIDLLLKKITNVCEQLSQKESDAKWIITWRELGMNSDVNSFLTADDKYIFKKRLQQLTTQYPKLAIIAGSISSSRIYKNNDPTLATKLEAIDSGYIESNWVEEAETKAGYGNEYFNHHLRLRNNRNHFSKGFFKELVRNTAYVFANGRCTARHDKLTPCMEVSSKKEEQIYQVAKGRNLSSYITIQFADGQSIPIGIEICYEHSLAVLQHDCEEQKLKPPLLHFILSNCNSIEKKNVVGHYVVHADGNSEPLCKPNDLTGPATPQIACYKTASNDIEEDVLLIYESPEVESSHCACLVQ